MESVLRRIALSGGIVCLLVLAAFVGFGCDGMSPFLSAQFANTMSGLAQSSGGPPPTQEEEDTLLTSVCDLPAEQRVLSLAIASEAGGEEKNQTVRFSITFAVSAGVGGFVCADELQTYLNAGYSNALVPGSGNTITIGCDTLTLLSGSQLLTMEFGVSLGQTLETDQTLQLTRRLGAGAGGSPLIPLPEIIVLGKDDPNGLFTCIGGASVGDICTQRGFVYFSVATDLPTGKPAEALRIQGTLCNSGFGTAPEWRLDKALNDDLVQPFQYPAGGGILVTVLDRSGDSTIVHRNQAVWLVTDVGGATVHFPDP